VLNGVANRVLESLFEPGLVGRNRPADVGFERGVCRLDGVAVFDQIGRGAGNPVFVAPD
jgi:hypothetical protein